MSARNEDDPPLPHGWRCLDSSVRFENKMMRLREDTLEVENKGELSYAFVERGPAVIIVPVTCEGEVVLIRQYRHPAREHCLEVPAGTARDTQDMSLKQVAAKELEEEIGAECERFEHVTTFFSNASMLDEECHVFIGHGVRFTQRPERETGEEIEILKLPAAEALELARSGRMKNGPLALALLLAEQGLRKAGLLR